MNGRSLVWQIVDPQLLLLFLLKPDGQEHRSVLSVSFVGHPHGSPTDPALVYHHLSAWLRVEGDLRASFEWPFSPQMRQQRQTAVPRGTRTEETFR